MTITYNTARYDVSIYNELIINLIKHTEIDHIYI